MMLFSEVFASPYRQRFIYFEATGFVHALLLRIQALVLPIKTLVLSGH
jgi:hypothetical protein